MRAGRDFARRRPNPGYRSRQIRRYEWRGPHKRGIFAMGKNSAKESKHAPNDLSNLGRAVQGLPPQPETGSSVEVPPPKIDYDYDKELCRLQVELVKLQEWVRHEKLKVVVLFEGRDAAGKGGT